MIGDGFKKRYINVFIQAPSIHTNIQLAHLLTEGPLDVEDEADEVDVRRTGW